MFTILLVPKYLTSVVKFESNTIIKFSNIYCQVAAKKTVILKKNSFKINKIKCNARTVFTFFFTIHSSRFWK